MEARELNAPPDASDPAIAAALAALEAGRPDPALAPLQRWCQADSAPPEAHAALGRCLQQLDRCEEALPHLQHALSHGGTDDRAAIALLRACLRLDRCENTARLGWALAQPNRVRGAALDAELKAIDALLRARLAAPEQFRTGRFSALAEALPVLLASMPRWAEGWAMLAGTGYELSPGLGPVVTDASGRPCSFEALADALPVARRRDLEACLSATERALALKPGERAALGYRARASFERGDALTPEAIHAFCSATAVAEPQVLLGPFPLRAGDAWPGAATSPAAPIEVPRPRSFGAALDWSPAVGATHSATGYALCLPEGEARGGSDLVLGADGWALHDSLSHPLGALANLVHDKAVACRHAERVLVRAPGQRLEVPGEAVSLLGVSSRQYGHWLFEFLPRLRHLEGHLDWQGATYLVDAGMPATHLEALQLVLGQVPRTQVVEADTAVRASSLWIPGRDVFFPHYVHQSVSDSVHIAPSHRPGLQWLRQRWLAGRSLAKPHRRWFVRRGTPLRGLVNQDEVEAHLVRRWAFQPIQPEALAFDEQVELFSEAEWVVGAHGSALSNAVVCPSGARMLTLFNGQPGNLPSWAAALEALGVCHAFVAGQAEPDSHPVRHHWRFRIDLAVLDAAMSAMASLRA